MQRLKRQMTHLRVFLAVGTFLLALNTAAQAQIPLPDAVIYGTVEVAGELLASGDLQGRVERQGSDPLFVPAEFVDEDNVPHYVLRIPMEMAVGAPNSGREAARAGDVLTALLFEDAPVVESPELNIVLEAAKVVEFNVGDVPTGGDGHDGGGAPMFKRGDSDGNGKLELGDPIFNLAFQFAGGTPPGCMDALDVDDNGKVDINDPVYNLMFQFRGGAPIPAPSHETCGVDPTGDIGGDLGCEFVSSDCADAQMEVQNVVENIVMKGLPTQPATKVSSSGVLGGDNLTTVELAYASRSSASKTHDDDESSGSSEELLTISPAAVEFGTVPQEGDVKTITVELSPSSPAMELAFESTSTGFAVSPESALLEPGDSLVVVIETQLEETRTDDAEFAVNLLSGDELLKSIDILFEESVAPVQLDIGNLAVLDGAPEPVAIDIATTNLSGQIDLEFEVDPEIFRDVRFVTDPEAEGEPMGGGLTATVLVDAESAILGQLVLTPHGTLPVGTFPVITRATTGDDLEVAVSQGEVRAGKPTSADCRSTSLGDGWTAARTLLDYLFGITSEMPCRDAYDIDGSGQLSMADAVLLIQQENPANAD